MKSLDVGILADPIRIGYSCFSLLLEMMPEGSAQVTAFASRLFTLTLDGAVNILRPAETPNPAAQRSRKSCKSGSGVPVSGVTVGYEVWGYITHKSHNI